MGTLYFESYVHTSWYLWQPSKSVKGKGGRGGQRATAGSAQQASWVKVARAREGALAHDSARPMNAGDVDDVVPLALKASGLEGAGVVPAMGGTGLGRCCARTHAGQGR